MPSARCAWPSPANRYRRRCSSPSNCSVATPPWRGCGQRGSRNVVAARVFFDVDDTLVDFGTAARGALPAVLGAGVDYALWTSLKHYSRFTSGELAFDTMRTTRMADFLRRIGRPEDA